MVTKLLNFVTESTKLKIAIELPGQKKITKLIPKGIKLIKKKLAKLFNKYQKVTNWYQKVSNWNE